LAIDSCTFSIADTFRFDRREGVFSLICLAGVAVRFVVSDEGVCLEVAPFGVERRHETGALVLLGRRFKTNGERLSRSGCPDDLVVSDACHFHPSLDCP
jgi:hypothetical protein